MTPTPKIAEPTPITGDPKIIDVQTSAQRPFWSRFLERKWIWAFAVSGCGIAAFVSGATPLSWELVTVILFPGLSFMGIEGLTDLRRLQIPEVPGRIDDVARIVQRILVTMQDAEAAAKAKEKEQTP